jgi:GntR family transcriptional repressor for pyruvate dehydrogenase complex
MMEAATSQGERIAHDAAFHACIATTSGNATLASMLSAVSSRTIRARAWRGLVEESAGSRTVAQHREILEALRDRDADRAASAALVHVATTEAWFRQALAEDEAP